MTCSKNSALLTATVSRDAFGGAPASFLSACGIGGIRVVLDKPNEGGSPGLGEIAQLAQGLKAATTEVQNHAKAVNARLSELEQKAARRPGPACTVEVKSWGQRFVESAEYKGAEGSRDRQGRRFHAVVADTEIEHKNITSALGSGAALIPADRRPELASLLPWQQTTIRDLVAPGVTTSNAVTYPRQTGRTNNAATAAEGTLKAQSDIAFEEVTAPVRTLAHFFLITRQALDDAPQLQSIIDREARGGLASVEDAQMLFGDGTGQNLLGLVPQASAFVKQWTIEGTPLDVLIQAIAQVEKGDYACDGMVLNAVDWRMLQSMKDTVGRYIGNSSFEESVLKRIWQTPVAATNRMPKGKFLVGPFRTQAQIFDRLGVEVLASTEDSDNFRRNLVTIRAEQRMAFTVQRPASFVYGDLATPLSS